MKFLHPDRLRELVALSTFSFIYIAITHNPVVRPESLKEPGKWTIEKAQSPLLFGLAAHNYLIMRDGDGFSYRELHGSPTEKDGTFVRVSLTNGRILRVIEFKSPPFGDPPAYRPSAVTVFSGNKEEVETKWKEGLSCAEDINKQKLPYPAFGVSLEEDTVNSNSVATTLLLCMQLPSPKVGLLTPGANNLIMK